MADDGFDTITNDDGKHRWTWVGPGGEEHVGPGWHSSRAVAIRAGRKWLAAREGKGNSDTQGRGPDTDDGGDAQ